MRSTCALYVDAGYLLASAATRVTGTSLRNGIHVEYRSLLEALVAQAEEVSGLPLLRVHWYDSARNQVPDTQQERIGELPKVKLRLGRFGVDGAQKGVDLRIGLDLVAHARNAAADVFFLLTGDDDLTEAVEEAQVHGVQVVVLAVPSTQGRPHGMSRHLLRAADQLLLLDAGTIDQAVTGVEVAPRPSPVPAPARARVPAAGRPGHVTPKDLAGTTGVPGPAPVVAYSGTTGGSSRVTPGYGAEDDYDDQIDMVVTRVIESYRRSAAPSDLADLQRGRPSVPREIDKALLLDLSDVLDVYDLSDMVRFRLRDRFWRACDDLALTQRNG